RPLCPGHAGAVEDVQEAALAALAEEALRELEVPAGGRVEHHEARGAVGPDLVHVAQAPAQRVPGIADEGARRAQAGARLFEAEAREIGDAERLEELPAGLAPRPGLVLH